MEKNDNRIQTYLQRVDELYSHFEVWLKEEELITNPEEIVIEEINAKYKVNKLTISTKSVEKIAEIVPIGFNIVGGAGRIDVQGRFDSVNIIYLLHGGPSIHFKERVLRNDKTVFEGKYSSKHLYKGVDSDDWYWIESKLGRAKHIDKELFLDILTSVSDYEFVY